MTRPEALAKLLALGRLARGEIVLITGWPEEEVDLTIDRLMAERVVTYLQKGEGRRMYLLASQCQKPFSGVARA